MKSFVPVVGMFMEAMREVFCDSDKPPLGGAASFVEHRPGADVPLDRLWGDARECEVMVFVNVIRIYRSNDFPGETEEIRPCGGERHAVIQLGVARCVSTMEEDGSAPSTEVLEREALVGLDDADRLEAALCIAVKRAEHLGLINQSVWSGVEPNGPAGGALAWTCTVTVQL
jgi:hypothetical protein